MANLVEKVVFMRSECPDGSAGEKVVLMRSECPDGSAGLRSGRLLSS